MKRSARFILALAVLLLAGSAFLVLRSKLRADSLAASLASEERPATTYVLSARSSTPAILTLPAALRAWQDTGLYARTTGYLGHWYADIGDRVKAGQLLALIEGPDLDQQLNQARAQLAQSQANLEIARISAERWERLGKQAAVAQQDVDQKAAAYEAGKADVLAAQATVDRLAQLKDFQRITAPYDGVISVRNAEVGSLINPGAGQELFHIDETDRLRVMTDIPQSYVRSIRPGLDVDILVPEYPDKIFKGRVVRAAGALDAASRTLQTEIELPNPSNQLAPGLFGQVRFHLVPAEPAILLPSNAAIVRAGGTFVALIDASNRIHLQPVSLGRDFGATVEIIDGLDVGVRVVSNPTDTLVEGMPVEPVAAPATPMSPVAPQK